MNDSAQVNTINGMIAADEESISKLEAKIASVLMLDYDAPLAPPSQVEVWIAELVTLKQGLEGLRLKHDSLLELEA